MPGVVAAGHPESAEAGAAVLREGGNAVDAAVATGLALAVTYPQAGNLGGGGFLVVHDRGDTRFLDYREVAPRKIAPGLLLERDGRLSDRSVLGGLSVAVPGTVAGLAEARDRLGTWSWDRLVSLVIPMADKGVWLTTRQASCLELYRESLSRYESTKRYFGGENPPASLFAQPDLATTLRELADDGPRAFYEGRTARKIVAEIAKDGGVLDLEDLGAYRPKWRTPLRRRFLGSEVVTPSLPSAGARVGQLTLGQLESLGVRELPRGSAERYDLLARIFRVAFAFEHRLSGDPEALSASDLDEVHSMAQAPLGAADLPRLERMLPDVESLRGLPKARHSTTHFCVMDRAGMAVSNTYTLNTMFGSKLAVDGAGFLLNNGIDDFRVAENIPNWYELLQGERNQLAPGRRPVSSMTPSIVLTKGKVEVVIGGSGGPRIPTSIVQTLVAVLADRAGLGDAIRSPRVHHQLFPDETAIEINIPESVANGLTAKGHRVVRAPQLGIEAGIRRDPDSDELSAILDSRFGDFW